MSLPPSSFVTETPSKAEPSPVKSPMVLKDLVANLEEYLRQKQNSSVQPPKKAEEAKPKGDPDFCRRYVLCSESLRAARARCNLTTTTIYSAKEAAVLGSASPRCQTQVSSHLHLIKNVQLELDKSVDTCLASRIADGKHQHAADQKCQDEVKGEEDDMERFEQGVPCDGLQLSAKEHVCERVGKCCRALKK